MEDQARDDAILALRLTALEEAGQERERRRARHRRRIQQPYILDPATAAAIASEGDVSEAIRMLQYQDIDENDFNVLLELDEEGGGVGAGLCGPSRSLTEEAIEAALRPSIVSGDRTSESCMICMSDYELNEEVRWCPEYRYHNLEWSMTRVEAGTHLLIARPASLLEGMWETVYIVIRSLIGAEQKQSTCLLDLQSGGKISSRFVKYSRRNVVAVVFFFPA